VDQERPERCPVCGASAPLERVKIVATASGRSEPREESAIWICPSCHYEMDRGSLRELEFESFLAQLMKASGQFEANSVVQDARVVGLGRQNRIDIN
jgi:ribosomal protein L37AE/L43A